MAKRRILGRGKSVKSFKRGTRVHRRNVPRIPMRGGIRL